MGRFVLALLVAATVCAPMAASKVRLGFYVGPGADGVDDLWNMMHINAASEFGNDGYALIHLTNVTAAMAQNVTKTTHKTYM